MEADDVVGAVDAEDAEELAYASVAQVQARCAAGPTATSELIDVLLERIDRLDAPGTETELRSVLAVSPTAREDAAAADAAHPGAGGGPLHGIPVLVKDNIEVAGLPSCAGSTALVDRPARADAPLVARLRDAGAVIIGSTNLSEWANIRDPRSTSGWSAVGGLTRNPWALDRSAGGSSSGSGAALAAGFATVAVGTETNGSIICPAALNGLVGLKPTVGAVPGAGIVPISSSQDSAGPMGRTAADVAALYEVLAATTGVVQRVAEGVRGLRVGVVRSWPTGLGAADAAYESAVAALGAAGGGVEVSDVRPPRTPDHIGEAQLTVLLTELAHLMAAYLPTRGPGGPQDLAGVVAHEDANAGMELAHFGHDLFVDALTRAPVTSDAYRSARRRCVEWAVGACLAPALDGVDVLVAPSIGPAWKIDLTFGDQVGAESECCSAPAMAGWPVATAPVGTVDGLPVGVAVLGRPGSEALLLATCAALEQPGRPTWRAPRTG